MSIINASPLLGAGADGYQIERSLRFNSADSAYLNRTFGTPTNNIKWTWSGWVKRSTLGSYQNLFCGDDGTSNNFLNFRISDNNDRIDCFQTSGGSYNLQLVTDARFRDPSAWYHVVLIYDSANATSTDRVQIYVNGTRQTVSYPVGPFAQNTACQANVSSRSHAIGRVLFTSGNYLDGYLTEIHFIDGQALTPSSFGETDTITGVWKPKRYSGTYSGNSFYLKFADNSGTTSTTLGKDSSGLGNHFTPNNFSVTAGAGNDSLIDVPTPYADGGNGRGNYATLNPLDANGGNFFNGNLEYAGVFSTFSSQNGHGCRSTLWVRPSGKWYVEAANVTYSGSGNSCMLGFTSSTQAFTATAFGGTLTPWIGVDASVFNNRITLQWNGVSGGTASATQLFASYASGDVVNFAIDFDAGKFWVGKNGTWYNSGDPAAGTNATSTFTAGSSDWAFWGEYVAAGDNSNRSSVLVNFGQRSFSSTPPSGFKALNTQNLPEPTIKKPSSYFNTVLFTGNTSTAGVTQAITGVGFAPDLVWVKTRNQAFGHYLYDAVRGVGASGKLLQSNNTNAESTNGEMNSLDADGFTVKYTDTNVLNWSSSNNVAWCWDESATPGFDIVTYTGDGTTSANRLIDHSLGVKPDFVVTKKRSGGTDYGWSCWHKDLGGNYGIWLNSTSARNVSMWAGYSNFSATKFTPPDLLYGNENGATYVNYLWSEVAGFSKFGSYTGNGSSDGPFVFCGFQPKFLLVKSSSSGYDWFIFDDARNTYNAVDLALFPNVSGAESGPNTYSFDFLSNGFKLRNTQLNLNGSGNTYIFAAFAEFPAKYSLAR